MENIETAEKQKMESENKIREYETLINNSKNEDFGKVEILGLLGFSEKEKCFVLFTNINDNTY